MNNIRKRVTSIIAAATAVLCLGVMPVAGNTLGFLPSLTVNSEAATTVGYVDSKGEAKTRSSYTTIDSKTTSLSGGWYVVNGSVKIDARMKVTGDSYLILTDGAVLTVTGGIQVASGCKFNVYTQDGGTGTLYAGTTNGRNRTATGGNCGIGGSGALINIIGGNVYAMGASNGYGIHGADIHLYWTNPTDTVYASSYNASVKVISTFVNEDALRVYSNNLVTADRLNGVTLKAAQLIDKNTYTLSTGVYAVTSNVALTDRIKVNGKVDLFLANGCTLTVDEGITVADKDTLTIYGNGGTIYAGTRNGTKTLALDGDAGIGAESGTDAGTIIINSGNIYANGGRNAAGIGGNEAVVEINGGNVYATGGRYGAGIGSSYKDNGSSVSFYGGNVQAYGGANAAGIGSGYGSKKSAITLSYTNYSDTIYASSYNGTVSFLKRLYTQSGETATVNNMGGTKLSPTVSQYTVSFVPNNGETIAPKKVNAGSAIAMMPYVVREGYTFDGWYTDKYFTNRFSENAPINQNLTLYAKWIASTVTVTFEANNGEYIAPKSVTIGQAIKIMPYVTKNGYVFEGWYTDKNFRYRFNENAPIYQNTTLYANWTRNAAASATIKFNIDGTVLNSMTGTVGDSISILDFPILLGSEYDGWYTDSKCTKAVGDTYKITGNATLYAKTIVNEVTVTFYSFGNYVSSRTLTPGSELGACEELSEPGFIFTGWYLDQKLKKPADNYTVITKDTNLYAGWEYDVTRTYKVRFFLDDEDFGYQDVNEGETAINSYTNYTWYTTPHSSTTEYNFNNAVYSDISLYAYNAHTVCLWDGDDLLETQTVKHGDYIDFSKYEGYSWYADGGAPIMANTPIVYDVDIHGYIDNSLDTGSTFSGGGLIAAIAGGVVALGGGFAAGMAVGKKKKKDE